MAPASGPVVKHACVTPLKSDGELSFERGDIRVVDRAYEAGWRGQLRGCTGTSPVNYVACISRRMKLVPRADEHENHHEDLQPIGRAPVSLRSADIVGQSFENISSRSVLPSLRHSVMSDPRMTPVKCPDDSEE